MPCLVWAMAFLAIATAFWLMIGGYAKATTQYHYTQIAMF